MCGIVGYAGRGEAISESLLLSMRDSLSHRGPDAAGIWCSQDRSVLLGHRRLSIIDLSPTGAQPMTRDSGQLALVFNGEIYNQDELRRELAASGVHFVGRSDTEVLLAAYASWGEQCVTRLRGMFAFAIYDGRRRVLFMARDRAGEKPLYWARHRRGIVFASELKALMTDSAFSPDLCPQGLAFYLTYGYVPGEYSILRGVHKLRPAHSLTVSLDSGSIATSRYWDIPPPNPAPPDECVGLVDELQSLITSAVREQLVADVPLAVLLSGGIDSSIITAISAAVSTGPLRTFTVGFPGHAVDESHHARKIADHFGTEHVELALDTSRLDLIRTLALQFDEPIADSSMIPTYLLSKTVSQHCKVVLGGDGGDELFGGYRMYQGALIQDRLRKSLPDGVRAALAVGARMLLPIGANRRNGLIGLRGSLADGIAQTGVMFDLDDAHRLSPWLARHSIEVAPKQWRRALVEPERAMPGAAMAADYRSYLPDDILTKVDRASMLCSLEIRAPLLDFRIAEFAYARVPNVMRASTSERKILLRALAKRLLPPDFDVTRKQGFSIPLTTWLTTDAIRQWKSECGEQIQAVLAAHRIPSNATVLNEGMAHRLFSLMVLTWWMKLYRVSS